MNKEKQSTAAGTERPMTGPCARIGAELDHLLDSLAPSENVCRHFRSARIEILKGVRTFVDERIQRLSGERQEGTSVAIE